MALCEFCACLFELVDRQVVIIRPTEDQIIYRKCSKLFIQSTSNLVDNINYYQSTYSDSVPIACSEADYECLCLCTEYALSGNPTNIL